MATTYNFLASAMRKSDEEIEKAKQDAEIKKREKARDENPAFKKGMDLRKRYKNIHSEINYKNFLEKKVREKNNINKDTDLNFWSKTGDQGEVTIARFYKNDKSYIDITNAAKKLESIILNDSFSKNLEPFEIKFESIEDIEKLVSDSKKNQTETETETKAKQDAEIAAAKANYQKAVEKEDAQIGARKNISNSQ